MKLKLHIQVFYQTMQIKIEFVPGLMIFAKVMPLESQFSIIISAKNVLRKKSSVQTNVKLNI